MDQSMFGLDIGVAVILGGAMIAYNLHLRRELLDMRVESVFDVRRYARTANIMTILYAAIAIVGLCVGFFYYAPALWITMTVLGAFAAVDIVRTLLRVRQLRETERQQRSAAARVTAPEVLKSGIWMLVYTVLQAANLFYFE